MNRARAFALLTTGFLVFPLQLPRVAAAAWPTDPRVNVPLCTATSFQLGPKIVSDGAGGAIVTWDDHRAGNADLYAQRVSAVGDALWAVDGLPLCIATGLQEDPNLVSDGAGGAIVTWEDTRSGTYADIYAQRLSAGGSVLWPAGGVAICTANDDQFLPSIVADSAGGAIVTWEDHRSVGAISYDIYAQRISARGAVQWASNGVALCAAAGDQTAPAIAPDGAGGAIVAWMDQRSGGTSFYYDIYARRVSAAGAPQWATNGVPLCTATDYQGDPAIVSDGAGGAIVTWEDSRSGSSTIYAQRISGAGAVQWAANGVALCTATGGQAHPTIVSDGASGAIIAWHDYRSVNADIYAQRISAGGAVLWPANGVPLCTTAGDQVLPTMVSDSTGGAIVTWFDARGGAADIYAQRISSGGAVQWTPNGVALCIADYDQSFPTIVSDGASGAIVTWQDSRGGNSDIYAQRVGASGQLGGDVDHVARGSAAAFSLERVYPNPSRGGTLTANFTITNGAAASLELLDVAGRRIAAHEVGTLGAGHHTIELGGRPRLAPGLYLVCLRQGADVRTARVAVLD